ncbi:hypothetical protein SDC9_200814 [bioreactor metagenome]|uniref:HTH cro/C1-type domain-containing protein n=1 Tax=bioreactor metagenome TaxID=1076179 RepID=A0A645IQ49_9ZZZZ
MDIENKKVQLQEKIFETLQSNLKKIRAILDIDQAQLGDMIGVSRQTINNIENGRVKLNKMHYLAIMAVIDQLINQKPNLKNTVSALLKESVLGVPIVGATPMGEIVAGALGIGFLSVKALMDATKKSNE